MRLVDKKAKDAEIIPVFSSGWRDYVFALMVLAACNVLAWVCSGFLELANLLMIYLVSILIVVSKTGKGPSILTSVLGILSFDFFMVPPRFAFAPTDSQYLLTLGVALAFTLTISGLMGRARAQTEAIRLKELRTASLFDLSRELAASQDIGQMLKIAVDQISGIFNSRAGFLMPDKEGGLTVQIGQAPQFDVNPIDQKAARFAYKFGSMTGRETGKFNDLQAFYLPLVVSGDPVGVLAVEPRNPERSVGAEQQHQLQTIANQIGAALQNVRLSEESQKARLQAEAEQLRSALLSSVSHDLRTPLAVITGSASSLLEPENRLTEGARQELTEDIYNEAERLNRLLGNLLEMTRLSAGKVELKKELQPLEEVVGGALSRLEKKLAGRPVKADLPEDLPMLPLDSLLMEQVFINLVENALKYTPSGSPIGISAHVRQKSLKVEMSDSGPGLAPGDEEKIFDKFYRGEKASAQSGVGLGLAICRAVIEAHGGNIWAENRPEGGACFCFTLPLEPALVSADQPR